MQQFTIGKNQAGQRMDKYLHKLLPQASTGFLYKMLRKKNITLNHKKAEGSEFLNENDVIELFFSEETFQKFSKDSAKEQFRDEPNLAYSKLKGIEVLYEDEDIVVLHKPCGILSQKAEPKDLSINEWLLGYLNTAEDTFKPSICNRLDRNTSGIILCGKSLLGSQYLNHCIKERLIDKFYHTICVGPLMEGQMVEGYLSKDSQRNKVIVSQTKSSDEDSFIKTGYQPLLSTKEYSFLEIELITGKPHQIRAHLASLGHPLIGDYKYGNKAVNERLKKAYGLEYQLLHARRVVFPMQHKLNEYAQYEEIGKRLSQMVVEAPYPKAFQTLKTELF